MTGNVSKKALDDVLQSVLECGGSIVPEDSMQEYLAHMHSYGIAVNIVRKPYPYGPAGTVTFVLDAEDSNI
jgi:hypothetical protein